MYIPVTQGDMPGEMRFFFFRYFFIIKSRCSQRWARDILGSFPLTYKWGEPVPHCFSHWKSYSVYMSISQPLPPFCWLLLEAAAVTLKDMVISVGLRLLDGSLHGASCFANATVMPRRKAVVESPWSSPAPFTSLSPSLDNHMRAWLTMRCGKGSRARPRLTSFCSQKATCLTATGVAAVTGFILAKT